MALPTLLDIFTRNGTDSTVGLIDEASRGVPEVSGRVRFMNKDIVVPKVGAARTIRGRQYKTLIRTALPGAGFRNANEGVEATKSTFENRLVETFILNPRWECDKAVADSNEDGPEIYIAEEADAILNAALMTLGKQFYYGRNAGGDAKGHPGLVDSVDAAMVHDATGSTAATGSSVWAVTFGPKLVQWVAGENGKLEVSEVRLESILDAGNKRLTAYVQELLAYMGVQVMNKFAVARIKNLTAQAGKTLTDAMLGTLLSKFPTGYGPDCLFMSRRSIEQLRASRTATNATGAEAPMPTDYQGVPIIPTDSISDTEAIS